MCVIIIPRVGEELEEARFVDQSQFVQLPGAHNRHQQSIELRVSVCNALEMVN